MVCSVLTCHLRLWSQGLRRFTNQIIIIILLLLTTYCNLTKTTKEYVLSFLLHLPLPISTKFGIGQIMVMFFGCKGNLCFMAPLVFTFFLICWNKFTWTTFSWKIVHHIHVCSVFKTYFYVNIRDGPQLLWPKTTKNSAGSLCNEILMRLCALDWSSLFECHLFYGTVKFHSILFIVFNIIIRTLCLWNL